MVEHSSAVSSGVSADVSNPPADLTEVPPHQGHERLLPVGVELVLGVAQPSRRHGSYAAASVVGQRR